MKKVAANAKTLVVSVGLLGLVVIMASALSRLREDTTTSPASWPPTALAQPCTTATLYLDQQLFVDRGITETVETLTDLWRERGWQTAVSQRADGAAVTLTARRAQQSFEADLIAESQSMHLLAQGVQNCPDKRQP